MNQKHPILIIEDDADDCEFIQTALVEIGVQNEQLWFKNGQEALDYLESTSEKTSLILSDVNMPVLNGFKLKEIINTSDKLRTQSIPFIFLSTSDAKRDVNKAYEMLVQGYFKKPSSFGEIKELLKMVIGYWETAKKPV